MTVDYNHVPAESGKLFVNGTGRVDLVKSAVNLKIIEVYNGNKVVKLTVAGEHCRLPDLTLLNFSVAEGGVNAEVLALELCAQSHSHCGGNALTERACAHVNAGSVPHAGVTLKYGIGLSECFDEFKREKALERKRGIKRRRGVTL